MFDYTIKGWPATLTLNGEPYNVSSCDRDMGLVYSKDTGDRFPHLTIHGMNKEGPDDWRSRVREFHIVFQPTGGGSRIFEYNRDGEPDDFKAQSGGKGKGKKVGTGFGSPAQRTAADTMAKDFATAIRILVTGR